MKRLLIIGALTLAAACGSDADVKNTNNGDLIEYPEFTLSDGATITHQASDGGSTFPATEGDLYRFELDTATGQGNAALLTIGDASTDDCLPVSSDECLLEAPVTLALSDTELAEVTTAVEAIPALSCRRITECSLGRVDTVTAGDISHQSVCCEGGNEQAWRATFEDAVATMHGIAARAQN